MDATCTVCEEAVLRSIIREFDELVWALIVTWSRAAVPADRPLLAAEGFGADAAALLAFPSVPAFALSQANNVLRFSILTVRILEGLLVNSTLGKATNIVPGERPPPACTQRMPRYRRDFFLDASRCISVMFGYSRPVPGMTFRASSYWYLHAELQRMRCLQR
jgi:hypothetical protein